MVPNKLAPAQNTQQPSSSFSLSSSNDGTFLLNQNSGKVWRFDSKQGAFLEVPVTSKILVYNEKTGKVEPEEEDPFAKFGGKRTDK